MKIFFLFESPENLTYFDPYIDIREANIGKWIIFLSISCKINVNEGNLNKLETPPTTPTPAPVQQQLKCVNNHVLLPLVLLKQAG